MQPYVLKVWSNFQNVPFGKFLFSLRYGFFNSPYSLTVRPCVQELKAGFAQVSLKQQYYVTNHIKTVHAIAVCNLAELATELVAKTAIPDNLSFKSTGMDVNYLKKATGTLTAIADINPETFFSLKEYPGEVKVPVSVKDAEGVEVTHANIRLWITKK